MIVVNRIDRTVHYKQSVCPLIFHNKTELERFVTVDRRNEDTIAHTDNPNVHSTDGYTKIEFTMRITDRDEIRLSDYVEYSCTTLTILDIT